jgi:predicted esterase
MGHAFGEVEGVSRTSLLGASWLLATFSALPLAAQDQKAECGLQYQVIKPSGGGSGGRPPAFVMLHGTGGGRHVWAAWARAASQRGMYVFLPLSPGVGTPQSGNTSGDNLKRWDTADFPTLRAFALEVVKKYGCDPKRVYLSGFSNGAWTAGTVGPGNPDLFSAVLIIGGGVAGQPWRGKEELAKELGYYILHGDKDQSVPVQNGRDAEKNLKAAGFPHVHYKEFPGAGHVMFESEIEHFYKWLEPFRKTVKPGSNSTLPWGPMREIPEGKLALVHLYAETDRGHAAAESFELDLFTDARLIEVAKELLCIRVERDKEKHEFGNVAGPMVLLVDSDLKVLAKWSSATATSSVVAQIQGALKRAGGK